MWVPSPARPGRVIGAAGPTTAYRMDSYAPTLIRLGLKAMIGKGKRSPEVIAAMQEYKAVYLGATGGAGALISQCIKEAKVIAFPGAGAGGHPPPGGGGPARHRHQRLPGSGSL